MSALIKNYLQEYAGEDTEEFDGGFITWSLFPLKNLSAVYISRIYIHGPDRGMAGVKKLWACINKVSEEQKAEALVATVCLTHPLAESLLMSFLRMGFGILKDREVGPDKLLYLVKRVK